jgi:hypothetical protein
MLPAQRDNTYHPAIAAQAARGGTGGGGNRCQSMFPSGEKVNCHRLHDPIRPLRATRGATRAYVVAPGSGVKLSHDAGSEFPPE